MCFAWISEQTAIISLYSIKLSVFKTEAGSVYCGVRNGSLNATDTVSYLKGECADAVKTLGYGASEKVNLPGVVCSFAFLFISLLAG